MKHRSLYLIYIMRGIFLVGLIYIAHNFKTSFSNEHTSLFDPRIAHQTVKEVKGAVHDLIKQEVSFQYIADYLINHWPSVHAVAIAQTMPKKIHVAITARTPWVKVNENYVLTTDGTLVDQLQFVMSTYDTLPSIEVPSRMTKERKVSEGFMKVLCHCYQLLSDYTLVFHNDTHIVLCDKHDQQFAIVCCVNQLPDPTTIERCNRIKQDLVQQGKFSERLSRVWLVDTRFANQIIVSADHGGELYGANCV